MTPEPSSRTSSAAPDWEKVGEEIACPLCGYNLRGLTEARCPECGYRFEWNDLLDPNRRVHPYLFEHHRKRNLWSFFKTLWGSTRPRTFWRTLHPLQRGSVGRLILYWVITQMAVLLVVGGVFTLTAVERHRNAKSLREVYRRGQWNATPHQIERMAPLAPSAVFFRKSFLDAMQRLQLDEYGVWLLVCIAWPWATLGALSVFQMSMRRARVRPVHVLRCVLYSADAVVWYYAVLVACYGLYVLLEAYKRSPVPRRLLIGFFWHWERIELAFAIAGASLALMAGYRLWMAYRLYLRFDHPFLTVLSSQVIIVLVMLIVGVFTGAIP